MTHWRQRALLLVQLVWCVSWIWVWSRGLFALVSDSGREVVSALTGAVSDRADLVGLFAVAAGFTLVLVSPPKLRSWGPLLASFCLVAGAAAPILPMATLVALAIVTGVVILGSGKSFGASHVLVVGLLASMFEAGACGFVSTGVGGSHDASGPEHIVELDGFASCGSAAIWLLAAHLLALEYKRTNAATGSAEEGRMGSYGRAIAGVVIAGHLALPSATWAIYHLRYGGTVPRPAFCHDVECSAGDQSCTWYPQVPLVYLEVVPVPGYVWCSSR